MIPSRKSETLLRARQDWKNLPPELRRPIASYVKLQVERALAPSPITKAAFRAHTLVALACYALILFSCELNRRLTVTDMSFRDVLALSFASFLMAWTVSAFLAFILRIQTREFRISHVLVAVTMAFEGFLVVDFLAPFLYFFSPTHLLAELIEGALVYAVFIYWVYWFLINALPTTRRKMVKWVTATLVGLIVIKISITGYDSRTELETVMTVTAVPYASKVGSKRNISEINRSLFEQARNAR